MNDYFEKKFERIVKKICSNADSPYTLIDRLKYMKKLIKKFVLIF